jgi:YidC/Oxa1 family membrane protein insertase
LRRTEIAQFDKIIDLGWGIFGWMNKWLVIPIFNWLDGWNWNYGIIILVLTIAIKLLLDAVDLQELRLQRPHAPAEAGDGCHQREAQGRRRDEEATGHHGPVPQSWREPRERLPAHVGADARAVRHVPLLPGSIELRQQSFLWADDLSTYDSILSLPFSIPAYGSHVSLFTILMAASTVIYTAINSKQMPTQQGMPNMKLMMYLFPVMMLFFMNSLPSGLSYYYLLANVISILQMTLIQELVRERGQDPRGTGAEHEDAEEEEQVAAASGGHAEAAASGA